jgi:hypothetical protein
MGILAPWDKCLAKVSDKWWPPWKLGVFLNNCDTIRFANITVLYGDNCRLLRIIFIVAKIWGGAVGWGTVL